MQPLDPKERKRLLRNGATEEQIKEYESLLVESVLSDPDGAGVDTRKRERRIQELYNKMFKK